MYTQIKNVISNSILLKIKKKILILFSTSKKKTNLMNIDGTLFNLYKGNFIENQIINNGTFEPHITRIFKSIIKKGHICLDIGANIGFHSIYMSKLVGKEGKIYAFEPIKFIQKKLNTNIHLSGLKNIQVVPVAVGSENKTSSIYEFNENSFDQGSSSLFENEYIVDLIKGGHIDLKQETCKEIRIDDWIRKNKIKKIDLVKIDIEGGEYNALLGMKDIINTMQPIIIMEYKSSRLDKLNISNENISLLLKEVYDCYEITKLEFDETYSLEDFNFDRSIEADLLCIPKNN